MLSSPADGTCRPTMTVSEEDTLGSKKAGKALVRSVTLPEPASRDFPGIEFLQLEAEVVVA